MCIWSHYAFRQILLNKAELFPRCIVIVCNEVYISKTCGQCGSLHNKTLGSSKTFFFAFIVDTTLIAMPMLRGALFFATTSL